MSPLGRCLLIVVVLLLLCLSPAFAQEKPPEKPWTGKLADGRVITKEDLAKILQDHKLWLESFRKDGKKADLSGANLEKANLEAAKLEGANLREAILDDANLTGAMMHGANLSGAYLWKANLSRANLDDANLTGADLSVANLTGTRFEPKPGSLPGVQSFWGVTGLDSLAFTRTSSHGLVELRELFKKAGMRDEERQVTFALNHTRREILWKLGYPKNKAEGKDKDKPDLLAKVESLFHLIFFEWTCDYSMTPGRPLRIMGLAILLFTLPYLLAIRSRDPETGIWLLLPPDRVLDRKLKDRPFKLTTHRPFRTLPRDSTRFGELILRRWRLLRLAFYFSLLSAFHIGWRELNVGSWIARLQKREYNLRATGWVRTVSGFQSLLSVYMLALWALSYFGRPFE